jgi:hypothetical protein
VMQLCSVNPYACIRINLHLRNTYYKYLGRRFGLRCSQQSHTFIRSNILVVVGLRSDGPYFKFDT